MSSINITALHLEREVLGDRARRAVVPLLAAGAVALAVAYVLGALRGDGFRHFAHAYLVAYTYFLSITLGAQGFVLIQHLTRARWSVVVRRVAECIAAAVPVLAILFIPILLHAGSLYDWIGHHHDDHHHLPAFKQAWFHPAFVVVRVAIYFAGWSLLARLMLRLSVRQDGEEQPAATMRLQRLSAPALVLFALLLTYFAFDALMSLDVEWFSTMYGVHFFAGCMVGFLAVLALACMALQRGGVLVDLVTPRHYHDIGRFLFAFTMFWAYIAYSQYMLIWYANIPEETIWVLHRQQHGWQVVSIALVLGHFLLPFFGLMSRHMKRRLPVLGFWSAWLLVAHWLDLYWLVMPSFSPEGVPFHVLDLACVAGVGCVMAAAVLHTMAAAPLVPLRDPHLAESLVGSH
ncbi:MAG: quinol:cytochrome C oxidoreductase [Candidatus Sumerlaeia bacterium]|nr:quinol:cytochrome C oxidoreductase [Candidatus Sumerlaeia bacterium]